MPKLRRPDGRIVSVSSAGVDALLARGYTAEGDPAPSPPPRATDPVEPPTKSASKAEWVTYAKAHGIDDADDLTKDQIQERLGV